MSEITERLIKRADELNLKQVDLMTGTGAGKSTVHKWFNHLNDPSARYLDDLARTLKTTTQWLLTGKGDPNTKHPSLFGAANVEAVPQNIRKAPVLNWVQAGHPTEIVENTYDDYEYFYDDGYGVNVYWLHVKGDSMSPVFDEDDLILVDVDRQPVAGNYVIAMVDDEPQATFKRFKPCGYDEKLAKEYFQLIPLNDFYPVIDSRFVSICVVGVVVKHERKLI